MSAAAVAIVVVVAILTQRPVYSSARPKSFRLNSRSHSRCDAARGHPRCVAHGRGANADSHFYANRRASPSINLGIPARHELHYPAAKLWGKRPLRYLAAGAYHLESSVPTRFVAVGAPLSSAISDVAVTATLHKSGGPSGGGYGLILRDQESARRDGTNQYGHFYAFEVTDDGKIGVFRRDNDQWTTLLDWTPSNAYIGRPPLMT